MAEEVGRALADDQHLLVQAGTGTGKSLAYLVPSLLHDKRVVVATATLALQHQLVERDVPRLMEAMKGQDGVDTSYAVLKGRSNYACLHRVREGVPDDQGALVQLPEGSMGQKVLELRAWAEEDAENGGSGERDNAPRHTEREWRQVSVGHRDCLGAQRCPFGQECFAELAREKAHRSHLIITNHSLLAIDAIEGVPMIPEYDAVVIDEAHELVARVTQAATDELTAPDVERAARRARKHVSAEGASNPADDLADAGEALRDAITTASPGRFEVLPEQLGDALQLVRDAARACVSAFPKEKPGEGDGDPGRQQAKGSVQDVFAVAERMAADLESDVLWLSEGGERSAPRLCVAPLQVWGQMRDKLLTDKTVVMTSATLMLGGDFSSVATSVGLKPSERVVDGGSVPEGDGVLPWRGVDVGSPFDYGRQGILYVARHLPPPGRDGLVKAQLDEIAELVDAADGRTLGLFSSRRAAEAAAEAVRERLPHLTTLAQGDAQLPELAKQFVEDHHTVLFGTLSLWQGLDVPGDTCQLVLIDRIPFPRPDDPLMSARQKAADKAGGNGFMQVAAAHAALLMAQGAGRLIRTTTDRGVVAVLDPRLATARYGSFLKASLPPMWTTTDPAVVRQALTRLAASAG
ncbi:ATP-dependent DNA helicase [Nocardioides sp. REDSEA-S30_B4]|uniref:ATP-dependent DNA helicase n=1 Tax=Nocardioides sp. REDSEA-S30_B4 TaxID=1811552 RepID=UPI0025D2C3D8|nr:ATP-dependent DNA helicase [Nocardioides sp. REDSEA-S30_B4]